MWKLILPIDERLADDHKPLKKEEHIESAADLVPSLNESTINSQMRETNLDRIQNTPIHSYNSLL